jgi:hypothetical protein
MNIGNMDVIKWMPSEGTYQPRMKHLALNMQFIF